jgi:hypothetical protein
MGTTEPITAVKSFKVNAQICGTFPQTSDHGMINFSFIFLRSFQSKADPKDFFGI